jgi:hypothetical protein
MLIAKKHSTTIKLLDMSDQWLNAIDNGRFVGELFFYFSTAFDLMDHLNDFEKMIALWV